jgi:3'(2'), 5'-bisphosphate nucleotidase
LEISRIFATGELKVVDKGKNGEKLDEKNAAQAVDPQTLADRTAQDLIVGGLKAAYPNLTVKGEEDGQFEPSTTSLPDVKDVDTKDLPPANSIPSELTGMNIEDFVVWVDPLDGTKEYTQGIKEAVTTLIGICYQGRPVAGVITRPFSNESISAIVGVGYFLHGFSQEKRDAIAEMQRTRTQERRVVLTSRSHGSGRLDDYVNSVNPTGIVRAGGCGGKVVMMIEGTGDAYVFPSRGTKKWDTAAPEAVLLAYGGKLTDPTGSIYTYESSVNVQNSDGLIATFCGGDYHDTFLQQQQ